MTKKSLTSMPLETAMSDKTAPPAARADGGEALPLVVVPRGAGALTVITPSPARRFFRVARFVPLVMGLIMLGGFIGLYFQPPGLQRLMAFLNLQPGGGTSTPIAVPVGSAPGLPQAPPAPRYVAGLGKLLPEGEVITVAPPFGAGDARVAVLKVKEGERVEQGAVLAVLDNERQFLAAAEAARATVAAREAAFAQTKANVAASREEARAQLARAEALAQNAAREFERVEELRRRGFAADQNYELRRTTRDETLREVERLKATLSRYGGDIEAQADVVVAARNLDSAKAELARAAADLDKAYVRAPQASTVLSINVQPGEKPGTQGLMNLGDIERMKAEIEVYQSQIGRVSVGDAVEVTAEALLRPLSGVVIRIGLEVGRQTVTDATPAANTDARVVKVQVALDAESTRIARRFTNLQVTARIRPGVQP
jgi:HlyD family secretion protein